MPNTAAADSHLDRYRAGVCRDRVLFDLILERPPAKPGLTILDIGCGRGFDGDVPLQEAMADRAATFVGVEPDLAIQPSARFHQVHRCFFEDAPIPAGSVDIAYAIMVLEHLEHPQRFWDKAYETLAPGGVFWGMTVDSRHYFCDFSRWFDKLKVKDGYLNLLLGKRGADRYENYPVHYRSNSPAEIARLARKFSRVECLNFSKEGQCNGYFPRLLHPMMNAFDRRAMRRQQPGTLLIVQAWK